MTTRVKSAILLVVTLIIGGVIGALLQAQLTERRFDRLETIRSNRGFARMIERSIDFESPEQKEQVLDIVDDAGKRLFENMQRTRQDARAILDSTRERLSEVLTEAQMETLEEQLTRRRKGRRQGGEERRRPSHPPDL